MILSRLESPRPLDEVRGIEGEAASVYFSSFDHSTWRNIELALVPRTSNHVAQARVAVSEEPNFFPSTFQSRVQSCGRMFCLTPSATLLNDGTVLAIGGTSTGRALLTASVRLPIMLKFRTSTEASRFVHCRCR